MTESVKNSLKGSMSLFFPIFAIWIHHLYHPSEGYRLEDHIEEKYDSEGDEDFGEVFFVGKVSKGC